MGVDNPEETNNCVKAAIQRGFIQVKGEPEELDKVVFSEKHPWCGHMVKARLGDLLEQPEYAYDIEMEEAKVACSQNEDELDREMERRLRNGENVEDIDLSEKVDQQKFSGSCMDEGRVFISNMCHGFPEIDSSSKFTNHCVECSGFGQCIGDYRNRHCEVCGEHYYAGAGGIFPCKCGGYRYGEDDTDDSEGYYI